MARLDTLIEQLRYRFPKTPILNKETTTESFENKFRLIACITRPLLSREKRLQHDDPSAAYLPQEELEWFSLSRAREFVYANLGHLKHEQALENHVATSNELFAAYERNLKSRRLGLNASETVLYETEIPTQAPTITVNASSFDNEDNSLAIEPLTGSKEEYAELKKLAAISPLITPRAI